MRFAQANQLKQVLNWISADYCNTKFIQTLSLAIGVIIIETSEI